MLNILLMPLQANSWMWIYMIHFMSALILNHLIKFQLGVCILYCTFIVIYYFPCSFMCLDFMKRIKYDTLDSRKIRNKKSRFKSDKSVFVYRVFVAHIFKCSTSHMFFDRDEKAREIRKPKQEKKTKNYSKWRWKYAKIRALKHSKFMMKMYDALNGDADFLFTT